MATTSDQCVVHCVGMAHVEPHYRWTDSSAAYGFVPEPTNPHDPNAVKVVRTDHEDRHLGYVAREFAPGVLDILQRGELLSVDHVSEHSNSYRQVLRVDFVSPALQRERDNVKRLTKELYDALSGKPPPFVPSPIRKRKRVSFAEPPAVLLTENSLGEPHHVHSPNRSHEHRAPEGDTHRTDHK
ncbi:MAG: hypothetical protein CL454_00615 [Acidimicrobiaceae bacterium]|nr:hypothetical protein [Acidimicrobiaceae bacterium]